MGFFKQMKEMQQQATAAMGGTATMGAGDMTADVQYAQLAQKLHTAGVEAPGVIHAIRPSGKKEFGGGEQVQFDVSITPADGQPIQTTIRQSMLPAQLEGLREGAPITVKYDPAAPAAVLIYGW